ncbi:SERTA domain-containing protein 3 [Marasmius crinis-equi]|uniref:SERTA domain-containing protein 3 n=1 Tax=Marasmius crinis-equi TaxID=585013 RepID=A0ABR3ERF0_9AGAR
MALDGVSGGDFRGLYEGNEAISFNDVAVNAQKPNESISESQIASTSSSGSTGNSRNVPSAAAKPNPASSTSESKSGATDVPSSSKTISPSEFETNSAAPPAKQRHASSSIPSSKHERNSAERSVKNRSSSTAANEAAASEPAASVSSKARPAKPSYVASKTSFPPSTSTASKPSGVPERTLPTGGKKATDASKPSGALERTIPTGGKKSTNLATTGSASASSSRQQSSSSSSALVNTVRSAHPGREMNEREPAELRSKINTAGLRRPRTYVAMSTGGLPPPTIAQRMEREARRARELRERQRPPMREMTREEIVERREHSPGWETDGSLGGSGAPRKARKLPPAKPQSDGHIKTSDQAGRGSASSPIRLDSPIQLDSPQSSRAATPDVDLPRPRAPSGRDASPSASSAASVVSPQLRLKRVVASSPPSSSPLDVDMPPSTQPRRNRVSSRVDPKIEPTEPGLEIVKSSKRAHQSGQESGRSKRRRVDMGLDSSEDEISAQLEQVIPSSPLPPSSPVPSTSSRSRQVLSHVEVSRSKGGRAKGKGSALRRAGDSPSSGAKTKYNAAVDPSTVDTSSYAVELPEDAPRYVHLTIEMSSAVKVLDGGFVEILKLWVAFEKWSGFVERGKLTTKARPPQVSIWIAHGRRANFVPEIADVHEYGKQVMSWWRNCAPEWRAVKGTTELRRARGSWEDLRVSGVNGLTSVVAALAWWMGAIARLRNDKPRERQFYERELEAFVGMLHDVRYSLGQLLAVSR